MSSSSFFKSSGTSVTIQNTIDTLITDAEAAKTSAETAATNAASSASLSSTYANNSSSSATNAANSLNSAQTAQSAAETAETNAETAQTAAETAETNAASSASTASTQASNASTSATAAASSASTASTKASEASTSATNAATSETNAATSATNAASSATTASGHSSTASTQASNASTSATNAATSETNAATSATTASTQASNASTSATNAASSASTASTQATNAANSATAAATSATNASNSATSAATSASTAQTLSNSFNNIYLGALSSAPTQDPDGSALDEGDLYYDTTQGELKVYKSSGWAAAGSTVNGTSARFHYDITTTTNTLSGADANGNTLAYDAGYVDVFVNGVRMSTADVTTTSGNSIVFADNLVASDDVDIVAYGTFVITQLNADNLNSGTVPDARITGAYTGITNLTMSGDLTVDTSTLYVDSANNRVGVGTSSPSTALDVVGNWVSNTGQLSIDTPSGETYSGLAILNNGTPKGFLYYDNSAGTLDLQTFTTDALRFKTNNTERAIIDSSGNVGIGQTPSATSVYMVALQVGEQANLYGHVDGTGVGSATYLSNNITHNSGEKYINSDAGSLYTQASGIHSWSTYPSGTAGATATASERMRITSSGAMTMGTTSSLTDVGGITLRKDTQGGYPTLLFLQNQPGTGGTMGADIHMGYASDYGTILRFYGNPFNSRPGGLQVRRVTGSGTSEVSLDIATDGLLKSVPTNNNVTGSSANMVVFSDGQFARSTSSLRYKNTINDATHGLTELLTLRPVTYKGNNDGDTVFGGLIAEEVHDAGLTEFVTYNDDGEPDALAYGNMVSLCIKAIQELKIELDEAKARITALENA